MSDHDDQAAHDDDDPADHVHYDPADYDFDEHDGALDDDEFHLDDEYDEFDDDDIYLVDLDGGTHHLSAHDPTFYEYVAAAVNDLHHHYVLIDHDLDVIVYDRCP